MGKGICELQGVDFVDIDVMMGIFIKFFGLCGGYIVGFEVGLVLVVFVKMGLFDEFRRILCFKDWNWI